MSSINRTRQINSSDITKFESSRYRRKYQKSSLTSSVSTYLSCNPSKKVKHNSKRLFKKDRNFNRKTKELDADVHVSEKEDAVYYNAITRFDEQREEEAFWSYVCKECDGDIFGCTCDDWDADCY